MTLVTHYDIELHLMYVKINFLKESLDEEFWVNQLKVFSIEENENVTCKLKKSIYGLK